MKTNDVIGQGKYICTGRIICTGMDVNYETCSHYEKHSYKEECRKSKCQTIKTNVICIPIKEDGDE